MTELYSSQTKVSALPANWNYSKQETVLNLNDVIGSFVDSFCLNLPDVKKATDRYMEQQETCVDNTDNSDNTDKFCCLIQNISRNNSEY